jgi:hypothetical protein
LWQVPLNSKLNYFLKLISQQASNAYVIQTIEDLNRVRGECVRKFDVTPERIAEYRKRVFREADPETPKYVHCVFESLGLFKDGVFITDDYLKQLGRGDEVRGQVEKCNDVTDSDFTIRAFRSFRCLFEHELLPAGY